MQVAFALARWHITYLQFLETELSQIKSREELAVKIIFREGPMTCYPDEKLTIYCGLK